MQRPYEYSFYSPHYAQAFSPQAIQQPVVPRQLQHPPQPPMGMRPQAWHQAGLHRCSYKNCSFSGSKYNLELHMMDRHLIFPPGWKQQSSWDGDPALKGKPVPIQGTTILLNSPQAIDAWIAERKRRWPTTNHVSEKKRKLENAKVAGQLLSNEIGLFARKRPRKEFEKNVHYSNLSWQRTSSTSCPSFSKPIPKLGSRSSTEVRPDALAPPSCDNDLRIENPPEDSDEDSAPDVMSSKLEALTTARPEITSPQGKLKTTRNQLPSHPQRHKKVAHSITKSQPTLLQHLLEAEIAITVSNLSQAIRFLVSNDYLRGIELKPGDTDKALITVLTDV